MAALVCEICGGKLMAKPGGIYECEFCGIQYDTAWAKEKIQEIKGTVKVEGTVQVAGTVKVEGGASVESLLKRGFLALEDGKWDKADEYFEKVLDIEPENAQAYLGKLMYQLEVPLKESLTEVEKPFDSNKNYIKLMQFGDQALQNEISGYLKTIKDAVNIRDNFKIKDGVLIKYIGDDISVVIPDVVTRIGENAFCDIDDAIRHCDKIVSITVSDSVKSIDAGAFGCCESLKTIVLPDSIKRIEASTFFSCEALTSVSISNSVTSIGDEAFCECISLTSINIPDSIVNIGNCAFAGCNNLKTIQISSTNTAYQFVQNCLIAIKDKCLIFGNSMSTIPVDGSVTRIGEYAFCGDEKLTSITIQDSNNATVTGYLLEF